MSKFWFFVWLIFFVALWATLAPFRVGQMSNRAKRIAWFFIIAFLLLSGWLLRQSK